MKVAFLFPGQGSQYVGMGKDIFEKYESAQMVYRTTSEISGMDIAGLSFSGPSVRLKESKSAQVAILTMSLAIFRILTESGVRPDVIAGHSSGEYSAITASDALKIEDGIRLVKIRGEIMSEAGKKYPGVMAAINGPSFKEIDRLYRYSTNSGCVCIANHNAPGQVVISGTTKGVDAVMDLARKDGARGIYLPVSGAFHSPLMRDASLEFLEILKGIDVRDPVYPIMGNVNASILSNSSEIRDEMTVHMLSPVRWYESIKWMLDMGVQRFVEVGPGKVLKGLILRIDRKVDVYTTGTVREIDIAINRLTSG